MRKVSWGGAIKPVAVLSVALSALSMTSPPAVSGAVAQDGASRTNAAVSAFVAGLEARRPELVDVRRDIHQHPDPSGSEARTAGIVAGLLRDAGFEVRTGVGGHGVVGVLRGSAPGASGGPVVAFRADMDAVRDGANDPMDFRSTVPGVNHICGHDIHTAVGLALARGFGSIRDRLAGTVVLIFQPAEETATGANAMLADGVFATRVPDAVFAYHTAPMPVGQIVTRAGTLLAGRDRLRITVRGDGDIAAVARQARDVVAGVATPGSTGRSFPVTEDFVAVRGLRAAPGASGASGSWDVGAILTTSGLATSRRAFAEIERGLSALEREGVEVDLAYDERFIAGIDNDAALVQRSNAVARGILGDGGVAEAQTLSTVFSEDFGSFQKHTPGVMYFLGVSNPDRGWVGMPHTPTYVADEEAIFVGAEVMAAVFLDLFERGVPGS